MSTPSPSPTMAVMLREATVAQLMALRANGGETLDGVIARLARCDKPISAPATRAKRRSRTNGQKYDLVFLGEAIHAATLGELFARLIDALTSLDTASVERLAEMSARKRAFVAKNRSAIHPGRPDLRVLRTASGWWVALTLGRLTSSAPFAPRARRLACRTATTSSFRDGTLPARGSLDFCANRDDRRGFGVGFVLSAKTTVCGGVRKFSVSLLDVLLWPQPPRLHIHQISQRCFDHKKQNSYR
jgi:hypothetical protein